MSKNSQFSNTLIMWYLKNKRDLPWRNSRDAYSVWLSEIIMQQTRILQGTSYYLKFIKEFNTVYELASADEEKVLKLWQGLGYYSRARNLHHTAKTIVEKFNGRFPDNYNALISLKGIGDYTASAIASISYNKVNAVVDGNVFRLLSRYFGIETPINSGKGIKEFKTLAELLIDPDRPGDHNQALMEFGALICTPQKPDCLNCVLNDSCYALQNNQVRELPVKLKKLKIKHRYLNYIIPNIQNNHTIIRQRRNSDIWKHLYEFPLYETASIDENMGLIHDYIKNSLNITEEYTLTKFNTKPIIHQLTHQKLYANFWVVDTEQVVKNAVKWSDLHAFALPVLLQNFVDKYQGSN